MPRLVSLRKPEWQWQNCKTGIRASAWLRFDTCSPTGPMLIGSVCWITCAKHRCPKDKPKRYRKTKPRLLAGASRYETGHHRAGELAESDRREGYDLHGVS